MVHAENHDMIRWIAHRLLERGHVAPKFHAVAHDPLVESEATNRAIALSRLVDVPVLIVHVAGTATVDVIRSARTLGARVHAESCPQYLFLTAADIDLPGVEGAKYCCSPPPGDEASQEAVWQGFADGTLSVYSSDHAPYRFDETGKLPNGDATTFKEMANGVPGIELRLPLLFSEGVMTGRIDVHQFAALTAGNHARLYGLAPRKGAIAIGADADLALWNERPRRHRHGVDAARPGRLHAVRRPGGARLAGSGAEPGPRRRQRRRTARRGRQRRVHRARDAGTVDGQDRGVALAGARIARPGRDGAGAMRSRHWQRPPAPF